MIEDPMSCWFAGVCLLVGVLLVYNQEIRRWWARGCKACLIELDVGQTPSTKSWAQAATPHTCWWGRRRQRHWKNSY